MFPDAIFVQILRDWRAAVASTVIKRRADAVRGKWEWRVGHEVLDIQRARFGERFVQLGYEELCNSPEPTMARLAEQCGLRWDDETRSALPDDIHAPTDRWREELDDETVSAILAEHGEVLARHEVARA